MSVQKITCDHPIFSSPAFLRDKVSFNILLLLAQQEGSEIYSDEENFVIVLSPEKDVVWAWTINDIADANSSEMWRYIEYLCMEVPTKIHIFIKSVLIGRSTVKLNPLRIRFAYQCQHLNKVVESHGEIHKCTREDVPVIAKLIARCDNIDEALASAKANHFMNEYVPYLWYDGGEDPVALSVIKPSVANYVRIGGLYIRPDCRSMGYERSLIHKMSEDIIAEGKTPMIFVTDSKKNNSSTRYTDMGFIRCGRIAEVEFA